jgi:hydroxymethylpyrimidine/phosphomethylpyrimidine kinase
MKKSRVPVALTIAGSDSGGGAGVQADVRVFTRLGVFGTTAITAVTAQDTIAVHRSTPMAPSLVRAQIDAVAGDLHPDAVKSGMLATAGVARAVAASLRRHALAPYVLDPVLRSSSGRALLDRNGLAVVRRQLLPLAALVTPNLDEAAALTGEPVTDIGSMVRAARLLVDHAGAGAALVTGGHLTGPTAVDVFYDGSSAPRTLAHRRIRTRHTHGTGCTLSAAITAYLALGHPLPAAVRSAIAYIGRALRNPPRLGAGRGPVG